MLVYNVVKILEFFFDDDYYLCYIVIKVLFFFFEVCVKLFLIIDELELLEEVLV